MALASGTRLGPYEVQSAIGAGGMGEVYRARDTRLDRTVAVKLCLRRFAGLNRMRPVAPDEANGKVQENALQSWPFFHWSLYPLISLAPGRH